MGRESLDMNPMGRLIRERNKISDNISYLVDKKNVCFNMEIAPINRYKGENVSETMYGDLEGILLHYSHRNIARQ